MSENKLRIAINGHEIAYVKRGRGCPIVFLHGNPTSSYLWRHVMPEVERVGQCIAPDLIGMGDSAKLPDPGPDTYSYATHQAFLYSFLDAMDLGDKIILVVHDWGSALGFEWARRNQDRIAGIAYMESMVTPFESWDTFNPNARPIFQALRSEKGETLILDQNMFVERNLPNATLREYTAEEMEEYRRPFHNREDRWPSLTFARSVPIAGQPPEVVSVVEGYSQWLRTTEIPKLFIAGNPGAMLTGERKELCRTFKNQMEVSVSGKHFLPEDSGAEIGRAIATWVVGQAIL